MAEHSGHPDGALILGVRQQLVEAIRRHLVPKQPVAFIDFPYNANPGDSAIWAGTRSVLRHLGNPVVYTCETSSYDVVAMRSALGADGVILLEGGGNFGDLWPEHQTLRENILADFPHHKIVQLPQSIGFRDPTNIALVAAAMTGHPSFVMMCRDQRSRHFAQERLGLDAELVPDAAFGLGVLARRSEPQRQLLILARTDHESAHHLQTLELDGADVVDWQKGAVRRVVHRGCKVLPRLARGRQQEGTSGRLLTRGRELSYALMVRNNLASAQEQLSRYDAVVTDRLHAHVLCLLLGIPHVVLDNSYGKVVGLHTAWTAESGTTHVARDLGHAAELARALIAQGAGGRAAH